VNIVFTSGFLIPQRILGIDYFSGLDRHIRETSNHVPFFPEVMPIASSDGRAADLAKKISARFPVGPIHIVAHSMGGLDSRIVIGNNLNALGKPGRIVSLTTLSTPHRGSPVADLLAGSEPEDLRRRWTDQVNAAVKLLGIDVGALVDLTTDRVKAVPDVVATRPDIRVRSYAALGRDHGLATSALLFPTHEYIRIVKSKPSDGLVTLESATYGKFQGVWPCDHADMVGHNLDPVLPPVFRHLPKFDEIIANLGR
jgi:triacylglycerol lipase